MNVKCRIGTTSMLLQVTQNFVLRDIAVSHFKSKSINVDLDEYCFKIPNYDYFLDLDQSINDLLEVSWAFQERDSDDGVVATLVLIRKAEKGDAVQRETLTIDPTQEASLCVWAFKRGGSTGGILSGFKKRYFILQSNTLYYSESPGSATLGYIPMSGVSSKIRTDIQYKDKISFELTNSSNSRSYILSADQLEFSQLHQALDELQLRRVKSSVVTLCQELLRRDVSTMQGLFRISGEKYMVESLKHQYDLALDPELDDQPSEVIAGVIKQYLRSLESPLIGFGLYNEYLRFGKMQPGPERTEAIITALKRLPLSQRNFLHYLCSVLKTVSSHSQTNLMNSKNLAIVIGPNLLRPQRETTQSAMNDNQYVLAATQALIDECDVVFGPSLVNKVPDTAITTEAAAQRQRASTIAQSHLSGGLHDGKSRPGVNARASRYSISDLDPSYAYLDDLKATMKTSRTVGDKIKELNDKHTAIMSQWNDLIRAIQANPRSSMHLSEFILNQSQIDTRWIDQGLSSLDEVHSKLSEIVELLTPDTTQPPTVTLPSTPTASSQSHQFERPPTPSFQAPQPPPKPLPPVVPPAVPPAVPPLASPSSSAPHQSLSTPNASGHYAPFAAGNMPALPKSPPPPPSHKPGGHARSPSEIPSAASSETGDIPPPPPPDFE